MGITTQGYIIRNSIRPRSSRVFGLSANARKRVAQLLVECGVEREIAFNGALVCDLSPLRSAEFIAARGG